MRRKVAFLTGGSSGLCLQVERGYLDFLKSAEISHPLSVGCGEMGGR